MRARPLLSVAALIATAVPARGQAPSDLVPKDPVVAVVRSATTRFLDRSVAEAEGYRRIGPDIPAMGEHWVHVGLLLDPGVDVERPEILAYVPVDGAPRLAGVGWAVALFGDETPPEMPGVDGSWHAHGGPVEEELLQVDHAHHDAGTGSRVAVLHAWVWIPSPGGTYAAENWALPAVRLGLSPEAQDDDAAARALSLARGGHAFLARQVALLARLDEDRAVGVSTALARAGAEVDAVLAGAGPDGLDDRERSRLAAIWGAAREGAATAAGEEGASVARAILARGVDPLTCANSPGSMTAGCSTATH